MHRPSNAATLSSRARTSGRVSIFDNLQGILLRGAGRRGAGPSALLNARSRTAVSDRNRTDRRTGPAHGSNLTPARSARFAGCSVLVPASFSRSPALRASTSSSPAGPAPNCIGAGPHDAVGPAPRPDRTATGGPRRTAHPAIIVSAMRRFAPRWGFQAACAGVLALVVPEGPFAAPAPADAPFELTVD